MELRGKHALIIGLGESGLAMAKWLSRQGARVRVADTREVPPNVEALSRLVPQAELQTGALSAESFAGIDFIALSPGVPKAMPEIAAATMPVISEVELFAHGVRALAPDSKIVAITGSNGKTTTTALAAHLLTTAGTSAVACGNISPSALDALMAAEDADAFPGVWVLELSSYQLETTFHLNAHVATVLNVSEDHLDRYAGSLALYAEAKSRIFQGKGLLVLNRDDDYSLANGRCGRAMVTFGLDKPPRASDFGMINGALMKGEQALCALADLPISGLHNAANVMAALALCEAVGLKPGLAIAGLETFRGLPHRVALVAEVGGVRYIDDSKGTNVGATLAAIAGLGCPVAIVLGGDGKGQDFSPLKAALQAHGRAVALIGRDGDAIANVIAGCGLPTEKFAEMTGAVRWLAAQAKAGDCVLLSPACASLDMYRNYADRADAFVAAVKGLPC